MRLVQETSLEHLADTALLALWCVWTACPKPSVRPEPLQKLLAESASDLAHLPSCPFALQSTIRALFSIASDGHQLQSPPLKKSSKPEHTMQLKCVYTADDEMSMNDSYFATRRICKDARLPTIGDLLYIIPR